METRFKLAIYLMLILVVFFFGALGTYTISRFGGFNIKNMSILDAIYFTVVTMSTVGYGDIYPITNIAKIFVIVLIGVGLSVFLSLVTILSGDIVNNRLEKITDKISSVEKKRLRNHTLLVGTDGVNMSIARKLKMGKDSFAIITSDKTVSDRLRAEGFKSFVADATSEMDMAQLNFDKAKRIVIDLRDKSRTVYALLVIRSLCKGVHTTVIIHHDETERHLRELGLQNNEHIINPDKIVADNIDKYV